jgi:simple sugar transport system permease protein
MTSRSLVDGLAPFALRLVAPAAGFVLALASTIILLLLTNVDIGTALMGLWNGSVGTSAGLGAMIVRSTPIALVAIGVSIALRAGILNVGGEGQLYVGALAASSVALYVPAPPVVSVFLSFAAALLAGAGWILLPAYLKIRRRIDEIITTVMMSYIGLQVVSYYISGPIKAEDSLFPVSDTVPHVLPTLIPGTSSSYGFVLAVLVAIAVAIVIAFARAGLVLRAVGYNAVATRYAGVADKRVILIAMLYSGAFCGLAGAVEILGFQHRLQDGFSPGFGMQGLVAAVLANGSPIAAVIFALVLGGLQSGGEELQRQAGIPIAFVFIVQGLAIMLLVANWIRINPRRKAVTESLAREGSATATGSDVPAGKPAAGN